MSRKVLYTYERIMDLLIERVPLYRQQALQSQTQAENIVAWIVGLSTGTIALILSQTRIFQLVEPWITAIFAALLLAIISGAAFRVVSYFSASMEFALLEQFEMYFVGYRTEGSGPIEIAEFHTIDDIAQSLKEDMGQDYDYFLKEDLPREAWIRLYNGWAEFWRNAGKEGKKTLAKFFASVAGSKPEEMEAVLSGEKDLGIPIKARILRIICGLTFSLTALFFVLAIFFIVIGFLKG